MEGERRNKEGTRRKKEGERREDSKRGRRKVKLIRGTGEHIYTVVKR